MTTWPTARGSTASGTGKKLDEIVERSLRQAAFFSVLTDSKTDTRTGVLIEHGPTRQIFEDPRDPRTQAYVTGRIG